MNTVKLTKLTEEANGHIDVAVQIFSGLDRINKKFIDDIFSRIHLKPELRDEIFEKRFNLEMNLYNLLIDQITVPYLRWHEKDSSGKAKVVFPLFKRLNAMNLNGLFFQLNHICLTALYRAIYYDNQPDDYWEYKKQKYKELTCIDIDELKPLIENVDYDFRNHPKILAYLTQCRINNISRNFPSVDLAIATFMVAKENKASVFKQGTQE